MRRSAVIITVLILAVVFTYAFNVALDGLARQQSRPQGTYLCSNEPNSEMPSGYEFICSP